jgi:tRNA 2-thiouridine synthesizing protein D
MGKLLFVLCETPFQSERVDHALNIADAAIKIGHDVSIFLFMDGVYNMTRTQNGTPFKVKAVSQRLKELIGKGVEVNCCRLCKEIRGVEDSLTTEGIETTGVAELNDAIAEADAVISFTGWN